VQAETAYGPDWRDAAAYASLLDADRSLFAWEWLRRDPGYRAAADRSLQARTGMADAASAAEHFGLVALEPPRLTVPNGRPLWRSDVDPFVLPVDLCGAASSALDEVDMGQVQELARIIVEDGAEHLLLSDGLRSIRLDGPPGAFTGGPICLRYSIEGLIAAERRLLTLRRFLALCRTGHFSRSLHAREARARRWIIMLRAYDGLIAGADQRRIAQELFSSSVTEPRWRSRESSVRSQVQRLVRSARRIAAGGYRSLLR
jgi:hypothetical protein